MRPHVTPLPGESRLLLDVARGSSPPGLRIEATSGGRWWLVQNGTPVLFARIEPHRYGIRVLRTGAYASPVPPPRAATARALADGVGFWRRHLRWAARFARSLAESPTGFLHEGQWRLRPVVRRPVGPVGPEVLDRLPPTPAAFLDWCDGFGDGPQRGFLAELLPLRELSPPDAARVRSYRRQVREGVLPPVLLWQLTGTDCPVIVDGHDRFVAALAEGEPPPMLLAEHVDASPALLAEDVAAFTVHATRVYRQIEAGSPGAEQALADMTKAFAADLTDGEARRTRAWPLPGGSAAWREQAERHAPGWADEPW
ncbi:hypothetical protein [Marinitenerispora sediminis]|uniref:Uncharacterized protein n=1 Tax=Marinitenerispora sediminis TaxID=1931232 RepID=A0A368T7Q9_9ACTN|nr:hypothetical protein [Marinitenerispora sediminis]RCV49606.1 hypothetical protein DEF28_20380 [Marinitenerispora sediminis]RCV53062.1 hypothetical protein DEF23_18210 [Marinitenerispora sediminis]RCV59807.1 hypothetical protein DEF24_08855 [Marinitenerispora sediminis]